MEGASAWPTTFLVLAGPLIVILMWMIGTGRLQRIKESMFGQVVVESRPANIFV